MTIKAKVSSGSAYNVTVNNLGGSLTSVQPISLRNVVREGAVETKLEDITNITIVNRTDGATIQYNSSNQNYEIKLADLDGGTF
jgi:hypothetical protein